MVAWAGSFFHDKKAWSTRHLQTVLPCYRMPRRTHFSTRCSAISSTTFPIFRTCLHMSRTIFITYSILNTCMLGPVRWTLSKSLKLNKFTDSTKVSQHQNCKCVCHVPGSMCHTVEELALSIHLPVEACASCAASLTFSS